MKRFTVEENTSTDYFAHPDMEQGNALISDADRSVELVSKIICCMHKASDSEYSRIIGELEKIFELLGPVSFTDEVECSRSLRSLFAKLLQQRKIQKLGGKTVIGLGGQFSAGKSKFINSLAGIDGLLPEAQQPTTSIPTYVIRANKERFIANLNSGGSAVLSREEIGAISHEFHRNYGIGFSSFIESIIVETPEFRLNSGLAFLDTPGYSKFDSKSGNDNVLTDKQKALDQLMLADRIIWLISADNGTITNDDISFLSMLGNEEKILIVLNKADTIPPSDVELIRQQCIDTARENGLNICGVAAYSSEESREYGGELIKSFLKDAANGTLKKTDIVSNIKLVETVIGENLEEKLNKVTKEWEKSRNAVIESDSITSIRALTQLVYDRTVEKDNLKQVWNKYLELADALNCRLENYVSEGRRSNG